MQSLTTIQALAAGAVPLLFAVTIHEAAHGWLANRMGDPTAKRLGRLSLNPIRHVDPVGTLLVPAITFLLTGFIFGWARPVPIDASHFHNPRRGMALVALAGPAANLLMALGWALLIRLAQNLAGVPWIADPLFAMGLMGVAFNVILAVLNLLPVPPLDGSHVLAGVLPSHMAAAYARLAPYGMIILMLALVFGLLGPILKPLAGLAQQAILTAAGLGGEY